LVAACGQRQGLLALDLGSIFEKLLHQKAFLSLVRFHEKQKRPPFGGRFYSDNKHAAD
jgi:hypothetical protein